MESRKCIECGIDNPRQNAETCSPRCYQRHKTKTVPKKCLVCGKEFFARGKTCSKDHAMELKKHTNRELFGTDWAIQTDEAKKKRVATNVEKFGVEHHLQTKESLAKLRATSRERYGTDYPTQNEEIKAKIETTNRERHGVANPFQSLEIQEKIRKINLERFGVEHPSQNEEVKSKYRATMIERYGVDNGFKSEAIKKKIQETLQELYDVNYPFQSEDIRGRYRETSLQRYGVDHPMKVKEVSQKVALAREEGARAGRYYKAISQFNRMIATKIEKRYKVIVDFEKAIEGKSYDLHIRGTNILIELNPLISHNADVPYACVLQQCDADCAKHKTPSREAHIKKATLAKENNYRLIQIYEWDSIEDLFQLLDGKLAQAVLKTSARALGMRSVTTKDANIFLNANHIQGAVKGQKWIYGLYHEDELVAIASFGEGRFRSKYSHEWLRYAVKAGYIIHGGANRLFQKFIQDTSPENVVSYVDFDHTTAPNVFLQSSQFEEQRLTGPSLIWFNPRSAKKITNTSLIAQGADRLLGTSYGNREKSGMDNEDIMRAEGFLRVFTSGNRVFTWTKPNS